MQRKSGLGNLIEEALLKRQQDALDEIAHLREDCRNRLRLPVFDLAERYAEGRLKLCLKFRTFGCDEEFHAVFWRKPFIRKNDLLFGLDQARPFRGIGLNEVSRGVIVEQVLSFPRPNDQHESALVNLEVGENCSSLESDRNQSNPMFVGLIEIVDRRQQPIPSLLKWFKTNNKVDSIARRELFLFLKGGLEFLSCSPERKVDSSLRVVNGLADSAKHLVKGCAQVVENFPSHDGPFLGNLAGQLKAPNFFRIIRIELGDSLVWTPCEKGVDLGIQIQDLGFGPFNLCEGRDQKIRFHDIDAFMAEQKDKDEVQRRMDAAVKRALNTPPKPHKPLNGSEKKPREDARVDK